MNPSSGKNIVIVSKKLDSAWLLNDGKVTQTSLSESHMTADTIELPESLQVLPTGFDLQTHLRFPGQEQKETLVGGLTAAFNGGYDAVCTMPNSNPFLDTPEILGQAIKEFTNWPDKPNVDVFFTGAATVDMQGSVAADISGLVTAGAKAITDDGWGVRSDEAMEQIFKLCYESNVPFLQHAEMPGHGGVATSGPFQKSHSLPEYPRLAESQMIERDIKLLKKYPGAKYHVLHVSTIESLRVIEKAKDKGLNVTAEVTPHHLFFDNTNIPDGKTSGYFKMNPPLFSPNDKVALQQALESGLIDCVSTDHAPHETASKQQPWTECPFGTRGLVTALPALLTLYAKGILSWDRIVEGFSIKGRSILGIDTKPKGFLFVDPKLNFDVTSDKLSGVSENNCFINQKLTGGIWGRLDPSGFTRL